MRLTLKEKPERKRLVQIALGERDARRFRDVMAKGEAKGYDMKGDAAKHLLVFVADVEQHLGTGRQTQNAELNGGNRPAV